MKYESSLMHFYVLKVSNLNEPGIFRSYVGLCIKNASMSPHHMRAWVHHTPLSRFNTTWTYPIFQAHRPA